MTKLANAVATAESKKATTGKAASMTASDKFENAAAMEGKQERVKSELAKAYERAENAAAEIFRTDYRAQVQQIYADCISRALEAEAERAESREQEREARVLRQILTEGKEQSAGYTIRFSDTENGMTENEEDTLHGMFTAAKQSMLKVKIAERERKAEEERKEQERKEQVMQQLGVTAEQIAALRAAGVIK